MFLIDYVRRDCRNTLMFAALALATGVWMLVWLEDVALKAAGGASVASALVGLWLGRHWLRPLAEPSVQALRRYGVVEEVLSRIQAEYDEGPEASFGRVYLLKTWLVALGVGVTAIPLADIVDTEKQFTRHSHGHVTWQMVVLTDRERVVICCPHELAVDALRGLIGMRAVISRLGSGG